MDEKMTNIVISDISDSYWIERNTIQREIGQAIFKSHERAAPNSKNT